LQKINTIDACAAPFVMQRTTVGRDCVFHNPVVLYACTAISLR
jgi:hypothetical protein